MYLYLELKKIQTVDLGWLWPIIYVSPDVVQIRNYPKADSITLYTVHCTPYTVHSTQNTVEIGKFVKQINTRTIQIQIQRQT